MIDGVEAVEKAEAQIDAFIERRARAGEQDPDELEPTYAESVRRHHQRRRDRNRWEWVRFFDRVARSHARMSEDYQRRAEQLLEDRGEGAS